ncbi:MAG: hydrogenase formation protein HypD [Bacteroidales bacterium]|nr:hydrogenase formation protein HypD [Bacteroidales bacterium]
MIFTEGFRDIGLAKKLLEQIRRTTKHAVRIMEVCGGHTMAIRKSGIQTLLPGEIELLSGPGCPVCVTDQRFIDLAVAYACLPETILLTYGDLIRVPGSAGSLDEAKASGADVRIIQSTFQALEIAKDNPGRNIIFAGIGFETTIPGTAVAVLEARKADIRNFFIISAHKTMPEAMGALIEEGIPIDGYIGPGHVSTIAGSRIFNPLADTYRIPIVISGFEPVDLLQSIWMLIKMLEEKRYGVEIQYSRLVSREGNLKARQMVDEVFEPCTQYWRGIGPIPGSGLRLRKEFSDFDAEKHIPVEVKSGPEPKACICGLILKGLKKPTDCPLFKRKCTPTYPVGACMVSSEGACSAYYHYNS